MLLTLVVLLTFLNCNQQHQIPKILLCDCRENVFPLLPELNINKGFFPTEVIQKREYEKKHLKFI